MRRLLVIAMLCTLGPSAHAGPLSFVRRALGLKAKAQPPKHATYAHLLTPEFVGHLRPETQSNVYSLLHYHGKVGDGSAAVIGTYRSGPSEMRALVLTNHHVIDGNHGRDAVLTTLDGTQLTGSRIVAKNRFLDYALLEVAMPLSLGEHFTTSKPAQRPVYLGAKLYSLGAATSMTDYKVKDFLDLTPHHAAELQGAVDRGEVYEEATMSVGKMLDGGAYFSHDIDNRRHLLQGASLASAHGNSGGPVFSSRSHELVGIHSTGSRTELESFTGVVPMHLILSDVSKQLRRGRIDERFHNSVTSLLQDTTPQPVTPTAFAPR